MNHVLTRCSLALCAGLFMLPSAANLNLGSADPWTGQWRDAEGGRLVVTFQDGVLDAQGADAASVYRLVCVLDAPTARSAQCVGDGISHDGPQVARFIYRSQWRLSAEGVLSETWQANLVNGSRQGKAEFKRIPQPASR